MDLGQTRRDTGRKRQVTPFPVIIVGEVFATNRAHPLAPVVPSDEIPFALLPICNTPLIDYILENLAGNGVTEVSILFNSASFHAVHTYLQKGCTARGRSWLESKDMKVKLFESARNMTRLFDATSEIVEQNLVGQDSHFLFVPIDYITIVTNLRELYYLHLHRARTIKNYAATLLCTSVRTLLEDTLRDVLVSELSEQERRSAPGGALKPQRRPVTSPADLPNHITMFVLQRSTGVVQRMVRLEPRDRPAELTQLEFSRREHVSVRTDLVPTGFLFCSAGALSLFTFHMEDQHAFLADLIARHELLGNVFGVEEVTPANGFLHPIGSLRAYIQANIDVCNRRFFPLTRDYSFAEAYAQYAVAPHCQTVYVHQGKTKIFSTACEPCVVVGEGVIVPQTAVVRGTFLGRGVRIGDGAVLVGCVVLDDAVIGPGAVLRHSLIGPGAVIGDRVEVTASVIGARVVLGGTRRGPSSAGSERSGDGSGDGVVVQSQAIAACPEAESEEWLTGSGGCGKAHLPRFVSTVVPARELFVRDPVAQAGDDDDMSEEEEYKRFVEAVVADVEQVLIQHSSIGDCKFNLKNTQLTFGRTNSDLCRVVTERLLTHAAEQQKDNGGDVEAATNTAKARFVQWFVPFFKDIVKGDDEMQAMLEATCTAIRDPHSPLHTCGPKLLQWLYNECDEDLYEDRGYCIVKGESLVTFGERMQQLREERRSRRACESEDDDDDDDDRIKEYNKGTHEKSEDAEEDSDEDSDTEESREDGMLRVAISCLPYIDCVKKFLEEEEYE